MKNLDNKFWPYKPKLSIILAIVLSVVLLILIGVLRSTSQWPPIAYTNTVLMVVLGLSLLPVLLAILDVIIDRGGSIGYGDFKINFGAVQNMGPGFRIPPNIGLAGQSVTDSGTQNILVHLERATSCGIVIVDLEDGHAWWETRLLVLVSGAERLGRPDKIVFVATEGGKNQCFQGWAPPAELFHQLINENTQYKRSVFASRAAANQWQLMGPLQPTLPPNTFYQVPPPPPWMQGALAINHAWMAFSTDTGLPNELHAEQLLQHDLGENIEKNEGSKHVSTTRLNELFGAVLIKSTIDTRWPNDKQMTEFFSSDAPYIIITEDGRYKAIVSRQLLFNEALKNISGITHARP